MKDKIKDIANHEKDTGSSEVQIALLTDKILTGIPSLLKVINSGLTPTSVLLKLFFLTC